MRKWIGLFLFLIIAVDITLDSFCADSPYSTPNTCAASIGDTHATNPPQTAPLKAPELKVPRLPSAPVVVIELLLDKKLFHPPNLPA